MRQVPASTSDCAIAKVAERLAENPVGSSKLFSLLHTVQQYTLPISRSAKKWDKVSRSPPGHGARVVIYALPARGRIHFINREGK